MAACYEDTGAVPRHLPVVHVLQLEGLDEGKGGVGDDLILQVETLLRGTKGANRSRDGGVTIGGEDCSTEAVSLSLPDSFVV